MYVLKFSDKGLTAILWLAQIFIVKKSYVIFTKRDC